MKGEIISRFRIYVPWIIRILIFLVFIVSGIAKLFPVWAFEKQMVDLGITSWQYAPYLARFIIAAEISIGFLILQPHFLRRIIIPVTVIMLAAFCVHLTIQMVKHGAMSGNCGCFGQLIPMSPLEAFVKNIITIGLLLYLFFIVKEKEKGKNKFIYLILAYVTVALALFVIFPFCPYKAPVAVTPETKLNDTTDRNGGVYDSLQTAIPHNMNDNGAGIVKTPQQRNGQAPVISGPDYVQSQFSRFTTFGDQSIDPDDGKKIFCFFVPGCDECRIVARQIDSLSKKTALPPVYIFFMNEETDKIPEFFQVAGCKYPYTTLDVPVFWGLMGMSANTPGVFYLWNGHIIRFYEGIEGNRFNPSDLKGAIAG